MDLDLTWALPNEYSLFSKLSRHKLLSTDVLLDCVYIVVQVSHGCKQGELKYAIQTRVSCILMFRAFSLSV